jgi:hypothetical protein
MPVTTWSLAAIEGVKKANMGASNTKKRYAGPFVTYPYGVAGCRESLLLKKIRGFPSNLSKEQFLHFGAVMILIAL